MDAALEADALALATKAALDEIVVPLSRAGRVFVVRKTWTVFGHARLDDHARERFGRSGRWVRDMAALGDGIERLPVLEAALTGSDGARPIGRVAGLLVARVASEKSIGAWVEIARTVTVRELMAAVRRARAQDSTWPPDGTSAGDANDPDPGSTEGPDAEGHSRLVRFPVPASVRAAFDETLRLHRAVNGCEATVTSFVEALIAESFAGDCPPDIDSVPMKRGPDEGVVEAALARSTGNWSHLPDRVGPDDVFAGDAGPDHPGPDNADPRSTARDALKRLCACAAEAGRGGAVEIDRQVRELIAVEEELQRSLGRLLCEMSERGFWSRLMFAGVGHYAEQRLGLGRTASEDRARLTRSLRRFPILRKAYEEGAVGLEAALTVVRALGSGFADQETERSWVRRATESTIKRLRDEKHALSRERLANPGAAVVAPMADAAWHESLRRDPGLAAERVGEFGKQSIGWCHPDVFLRLRLPDEIADGFTACVEAHRRAVSVRVEAVPWDAPWPEPDSPPSVLAARVFSVRCRRVPAWVGLLAMLEDYVATWDDPRGMPRRASEEIYRRDGWRCTAPGCTSRRNLEDHHLVRRSQGGSNELSNRTCLCRFHHQMGAHGALADCSGTAPLGVRWRLGTEEVGVRYRNETRITPP